ncbi:hypothetical protein MBLNU459_g5660t1 [Dothideomycetes sp. NU459]
MDRSSSSTSPLKTSGIPRVSKLPTLKAPPPAAGPSHDFRSSLASPTKADFRSSVASPTKVDFRSSIASPTKAPAVRATPAKVLPRPTSTVSSFRTSISANSGSALPTPKATTHRPTLSLSDRTTSSARKPLSRPTSRLAQPRQAPLARNNFQQAEDSSDLLGSLDGFRAASRQSVREESPPFEDQNVDPEQTSTPKPKKSSRLSLSDRTVESLSRLPPTPATDRRRSSFFAPQSPMGPPSRPASAMSTNPRPGTSDGSYVSSYARPASPAKRAPPGSKSNNRMSVDYSAVKSTPSRRSVSAALPRASMDAPMARSAQPQISSRPASSRISAAPSVPASNRGAMTKTTTMTRSAVGSIARRKEVPASNITTRTAKATVVSDALSTKASTSSATLREQIARAKANKKPSATSSQDLPQFDGSNESEFDLATDPFNSRPKDNKGLLRKRIDAARADGRLNIAAMGVKSIPLEVLTMYDADQMTESKLSWSESVDLVRFIAADNEIETIADDIFPDLDPATVAMSDDVDAKGLQFGGLEFLDLHGNIMQNIPIGLRRLERLTTLNLSHNKFGNAVFDTISQIDALRDLKLSHNNISGYLPPSFSRMSNLTALDLQCNRLLNLPESIRDLVNLKVLNVSGNQLTGLPMDVLESLPLTDLNVANNAMVGALFPFSVAGIPRLQYLDVSNNSLASLAFSENVSLPALKTLNIANNRITVLPNISSWTELVTLAAEDNKIVALPVGFTALKNLRQVDFTGNDLTKLNDEISLMDSLLSFKIAANPLKERRFLNMTTEELKRDLRNRLEPSGRAHRGEDDFEDEGIDIQSPQDSLPQWKLVSGTLDLRERDLSDHDADALRSFLGTNDVREMKLSRNGFSSIPFELSMAQNLKVLDMSGCALGHNYLTELVSLPALQELLLVGNKILSCEPLMEFFNAPGMTFLDISNNRLSGSLPALRQAYPELRVLYARDNKIDAISVEALEGLHSADLASNNIGILPHERIIQPAEYRDYTGTPASTNVMSSSHIRSYGHDIPWQYSADIGYDPPVQSTQWQQTPYPAPNKDQYSELPDTTPDQYKANFEGLDAPFDNRSPTDTMAIKHNQQIPHNHFRKDWQRRVRVHFDQPGRKKARRNARQAKAAAVAPRPTDKLRPVVRCPTIKYNRRVRAGRGFSLTELKAAGIPRKLAPTIGISVDPRRANLSEESLAANVERLKAYRARLILFPRKSKAPKKGDASAEEVKAAKEAEHLKTISTGLPINAKVVVKEGKLADYPSEEKAYRKLRDSRSEARLVGVREKRAKAAADEEKAAKK